MSDWTCPLVTIGDIPIPQQRFTWALTAGPQPYVSSFWVPMTDYDQFLAIPNPTSLKLTFSGGTTSDLDEKFYVFDKVWLLAPARSSQYQCIWRIADNRWALTGKKVYCSYNKTRIKNQLGQVVAPEDASPAKLRAPYDTFAVGRYLPWSVNDGVHPYTVQEILILELKKIYGKNFGVSAVGEDLSFVLENIEANGEDIFVFLSYLCNMGKINLSVGKDGIPYSYSIFNYIDGSANVMQTINTMIPTAPSTIYKQDKRKIRPKKITVYFEKKVETWIVAGEQNTAQTDSKATLNTIPSPLAGVWDQQDILNRRVIGCINVVQAPLPVTYHGSIINIGEWLPMVDFLHAYGITEAFIQQGYFAGIVETKLAVQITATGVLADEAVRQATQIVGAIKAHYRQTYMIDPYWMDHIKFWEPRRVSVINNYDRYSPVSPLFSDYCIIPYLRNPVQAKGVSTWNYECYNWIADTEDPLREKPTAGSVSTVSQPLGIFRVTYPTPKDQQTYSIIPFAITPLPFPATNAATPYLKASAPRNPHTMNTIFSIIWDTDQKGQFTPAKYYNVDVAFPQEGLAEYPAIEYLSAVEYARIPAVTSTITKNKATKNKQEVPANEGFLTALANSEAGRIMIRYKDLYAGVAIGAGFVEIRPIGNINSIVYSFSPEGGAETIIDMRETLPTPLLEHSLTQEQIDYLRKHVTRVDNAAEARGGT